MQSMYMQRIGRVKLAVDPREPNGAARQKGGVLMPHLRVLAAAACLFLAQPAWAQADADASKVERLELADELMTVMDFAVLTARTMEAGLPVLMDREFPGLSQAEKAEFLDVMRTALMEVLPAYEDEITEIYAETFTTAELRAMIAFYGTAEGRSAMAKTPEVSVRVEEVLQGMLPRFARVLRERGCARYGCERAERPT